jgi:hypothetical protein
MDNQTFELLVLTTKEIMDKIPFKHYAEDILTDGHRYMIEAHGEKFRAFFIFEIESEVILQVTVYRYNGMWNFYSCGISDPEIWDKMAKFILYRIKEECENKSEPSLSQAQ